MMQRGLRPFGPAIAIGMVLATAAWAQPTLEELRKQLAAPEISSQIEALEEVAELGASASELVPDVVKLLASSDVAVRHEAVAALGAIGPAAAPAIPQLKEFLTNGELLLRYESVVALRSIGADRAEILAAVKPLLTDADRMVQVEAAATLLAFGTDDKPAAIQALVEALKDGRSGIRSAAIPWLTQSGADAIAPLREILGTGPAAAQAAAAEALGDMGALAAPAVPQLVERLSANSPAVVAAAARALTQIGISSDETLAALHAQCGHAAAPVRVAVLQSLMRLGPGLSAVGRLQAGLKDDDVLVRLAACDALAALGPRAEVAIPELVNALHDPSGAVTIRAADALGQVGPAALPALRKLLDDEHLAELALHTLEAMGPAARPASNDLIQKLKAPGAIPQRSLCLALAAIGADVRTAGPALKEILNDEQSEARPAAAYALGRLGDRSAVKDLTNLVESDQPLLRLAATWALLELEPGNPEYVKIAVPRLTEALSRPEPAIRLEAARTLGRLGVAGQAAVPALIARLADDQDQAVRITSAMALAELGTTSETAVAHLTALLSQRDIQGRRAAMYVLGRLGTAAASAVPALRRVLQSGPSEDRIVAAWALLKIHGTDPDTRATALPVVIGALGRERPEVVVQLVKAAGPYAAQHEDVRAAIASLRDSQDPALRAAAYSALDSAR